MNHRKHSTLPFTLSRSHPIMNAVFSPVPTHEEGQYFTEKEPKKGNPTMQKKEMLKLGLFSLDIMLM